MTDYQMAVAEHMKEAPQPLAEYVRGRLVSSITWREDQSPINLCEFSWVSSEEGYEFWVLVDMKNWPKAMNTDFWKKHTAPSEAPSKRPKGVIGQWYTMTSDFYFRGLVLKEAGYTWQCQDVYHNGVPTIDRVVMGDDESYRLATPEEIEKAKAKGEAPSIEFGKPEHPHEEYDFVNPKHYQEFSIEVIDMMAAIWGKEKTATHCEMCAFKYKLRAGSKPDQPIERDLDKAAWYLSKAKELRDA